MSMYVKNENFRKFLLLENIPENEFSNRTHLNTIYMNNCIYRLISASRVHNLPTNTEKQSSDFVVWDFRNLISTAKRVHII